MRTRQAVRGLSYILPIVGVGLAGMAVRARAMEMPPTTVAEENAEVQQQREPAAQGGSYMGIEDLPPFTHPLAAFPAIAPEPDVHTTIPTRPRLGILKYLVQSGDTLFGIAEEFDLKPESVLWGNWYELGGDPHLLSPGQELNILPVDGVLHRWTEGEGLNGVASFYGVTAQDIIEWPGNELDPSIDPAAPGLEEGTVLIVPGGRREPPSWQMLRITRTDPAVASILGPGACAAVSSGPIGDGLFGWPTPGRTISGYNYIPGVHEAIDIGGSEGNAIYASDDGVVVYAGWNDWGYGYTVVLDHGNGWQTLYAHLSRIDVGCGQAVYQGNTIAGMGCTGNCTGTHLHFEMRSDSYGRVNPLLFLP